MTKFFAAIAMICCLSGIAHAEMDEVHTPADMVRCMENYIVNWIVAPDQIESWEHQPNYTFAGSYFHASWHTKALMQYGSFGRMAGPKDPIYCKYQTDSGGKPDWKSGTCTATIANGDVEFELESYEQSPTPTKTEHKIATISQGKILCYNLAPR